MNLSTTTKQQATNGRPPASTMLFEYGGCVRGKLTYFAVWATPVGKIQTRVQRKDDPKAEVDTEVWASRLDVAPGTDTLWQFVASLGYKEIASREVSKHGDLTPENMETIRADAQVALERAVLLLS